MAGGMHGNGVYMAGGVCMAGGWHMWQGGMHDRAGGVRAGETAISILLECILVLVFVVEGAAKLQKHLFLAFLLTVFR